MSMFDPIYDDPYHDEDEDQDEDQQEEGEQPEILPVPTGLELTELDDYFRASPYVSLEELRVREPVHRDTVLNRIFLTRHDDVAAVLRNDALSSDPASANADSYVRRPEFETHQALLLQRMDGPRHARLRGLLDQVFTPAAMAATRPRIRAIVTPIIDDLEENDFEFDVIAKYAGRIPPLVTATLLGIEPGRQRQFNAWAVLAAAAHFEPNGDAAATAAADAARNQLAGVFADAVAARRQASGPDLISALLRAEYAGERLGDDEIVQQCLLLLTGNTKTIALIGNGIKAFLQNTRQMTLIRQQPHLLENAIEEVLRFDAPVIATHRVAHQDMAFDGCPIAKGETLSVSLAAANRDPAIYPNPDDFDVERADTHHHAFGAGRHACPGATLARIIAQETLFGLITRFEEMVETSPRGWTFATLRDLRSLKQLWIRS
jgi:cytochrome P450